MATEKHEVLLRLRAIELLAYWEGRLVTNRLMAWFGISRQQASCDIKRYLQEHNPGALVHDPAVKAYVPRPGFSPVLTNGQINEYLDMISGQVSDSMTVTPEAGSHLAFVQLPDCAVQPEVVRAVMKACRVGGAIKILYASMAHPSWAERVISPHTLVYTGFRWYTRAYCHKRGEFRDFILSRIDRTPEPVERSAPGAGEDQMWQEIINLTLIPNKKLTDGQKALVEKDFGMSEGRIELNVRKALAHYTLQRYQAAIAPEQANDEFQYPMQLLESDRRKLGPYLFGSDA